MEPLRQALKVTRIQYQVELTSKRDEMAGNKSKDGLVERLLTAFALMCVGIEV